MLKEPNFQGPALSIHQYPEKLTAPFVVYAEFEQILQRVGDKAMVTTQGVAAGGDELAALDPSTSTSHAALHKRG